MPAFSAIQQWLRRVFFRRKKNDWLEDYNRETAKPKHPLPLDPDHPTAT